MPHNNPGFDIVSRDDSGNIVRHIEVKSVSGAWGDLGVGLTRTQFDFGRQHPATSWLYVVEHALDGGCAQIRRIADPAGRAQEFLFDGGWAAVSDRDQDDGQTSTMLTDRENQPPYAGMV